jgi:uncharacterized protein (DUF2252 family)
MDEDPNNRNVWQLIQSFDRQRISSILPQKYAKLRKNAFAFFRGTCHLFYHDLPVRLITSSAPVVWICGDLHVENFGTYKGEDRQIYFGINDFDEGALAPCTWDITRLVISILLAAECLNLDLTIAQNLANLYLNSYANTLTIGRIQSIVEDNAQGIVKSLLKDLHKRKRIELLDDRTKLIKGRRQLKFDDEKILTIAPQKYQKIARSIDNWARLQANPEFFEILDIGFRVAGTGSLGLDRYLILVVGKGSSDNNYLLDFKQQPISALQPYLSEQPQWQNQAMRVMTVQNLVQSAPPALLAAIELDDSSYLLRELQPTQDKITLKADKIDLSQLEKLIDTIAQTTAFAHLHGSGKFGAAIAQDLINFGNNSDWQQELLTYAQEYTKQVELDYQDFHKASQDLD